MKTRTLFLVAFVGCVTVGQSADPVFHPDGNASYLEQLRQVRENAEKQTEELKQQTDALNLEATRLECLTALMKKADALRVESVKKRDPDAAVLRMAGAKIYAVADELSAVWFPTKHLATVKPDKTGQSKQTIPTQTAGH